MNTFSSCKKILLAVFSIIGLTLLSGCGGSGGGSNTPTAVTLNSISVTPSSLTITHGTTASLGAVGIYTDGSTADLTSQVTWVSAASGTVAVSGNGVVSGIAEGSTTITATLNSVTSPAGSITVTAATLRSIAVTPASTTLPKGTSSPLIATGTYSDGSYAVISSQVTWHSASIATATVGTDGSVKGVEVGSTKVYASSNSINSPNVDITVTDAVLSSIAITTEATIPKGTTANLIATGTYSDNTTANITTLVTWTSANSLTATVGIKTGIVYGATVGTTTVTAALGSMTSSNEANIDVIDATLSSIAITATSTTLPKGTSATLTATGTYSDGSHPDISTQVSWTSADLSIATVVLQTGTVTVTGNAKGPTKVHAFLNGITSADVDINVTDAVLTSIALTPSPVSLAKGASTNLTATGTYSDSTTEDITTKSKWTSDTPATATVGISTGIVTSVAVGSTNVSALFDGVLSPEVSISVSPVTWNPADMGTDVYLANANLTAKSTATWYRAVRATLGVSSGKAYWEISPVYNPAVFGIMGPSANLENYISSDAFGWGLYPTDGTLSGNGKNPLWVAPAVPYGSVIGFGLDMGDGTGNGTLRIWVNGVDKGIAFTGLTGTIYPASTIYADGVTANFGATHFVTDPLPDGYNADVFQH